MSSYTVNQRQWNCRNLVGVFTRWIIQPAIIFRFFAKRPPNRFELSICLFRFNFILLRVFRRSSSSSLWSLYAIPLVLSTRGRSALELPSFQIVSLGSYSKQPCKSTFFMLYLTVKRAWWNAECSNLHFCNIRKSIGNYSIQIIYQTLKIFHQSFILIFTSTKNHVEFDLIVANNELNENMRLRGKGSTKRACVLPHTWVLQ